MTMTLEELEAAGFARCEPHPTRPAAINVHFMLTGVRTITVTVTSRDEATAALRRIQERFAEIEASVRAL